MNTYLTFSAKSLQDRNVSYLKRIGKNLTMLGKLTFTTHLLCQILIFVPLFGTFVVKLTIKQLKKFRKWH